MNQQPLKKLVTIVAAATLLSACSLTSDPVPSKGDFAGMEDYAYELASFNRIKIKTNSKIDIKAGEKQYVTVSTEPDHIQYITVEVNDGELVIEHNDKHTAKRHTSITIGVTDLDALVVDAISETHATGIDSESLYINFDVIGEAYLSGRCEKGQITVDAIGDFNAQDLHCKNLDVSIDSIGSSVVFASHTIEITGDSIGDISVYGDPEIKSAHFSGLGDHQFK